MTRRLDVALIAATLMARPLLLGWAVAGGAALGWRPLLIEGVAAPLVGLLFWIGHRRARFAIYIFLTMDLLRAAAGQSWALLVLDAAILIYLQTASMRRCYPRIDAAAIRRRWARD